MTQYSGTCHCGAISYTMTSDPLNHALCHCSDCRAHSGAPMVGWAMLPVSQLDVSGSPKIYHSSTNGRRHFCADCGTGLFYTNEEMLPSLIDVQTATLKHPEALPPQLHIQVAERLKWMKTAHELPKIERYPNQA